MGEGFVFDYYYGKTRNAKKGTKRKLPKNNTDGRIRRANEENSQRMHIRWEWETLYFLKYSTPRVFGPQCEETVQPARVV